MANRLTTRCDGKHRHALLTRGKATYAEVYPAKLCSAIIKVVIDQLYADGKSADPRRGVPGQLRVEHPHGKTLALCSQQNTKECYLW